MKRMKRTYSYLPDDCWESIIQIILDDGGTGRSCLNSLSLVSKQFLFITNSLIYSLTVYPSTVPFLKLLLKRFTNLTSLDLSYCRIDVDNILHLISCFLLKNLTSLAISSNSTFPSNGLQAFSQNITTLTSLTCSNMYVYNNDLLLIADCFPLLKELNLVYPSLNYRTNFIKGICSLLSKRQLVNYQTDFINGIHSLLSKCQFIQHLNLECTFFLNDTHVTKLSLFHGDLVSINLNDCSRLTGSALFSLVRNCPSLSEIKMENTDIANESLNQSGVYPQLKSLYLGRNKWLCDIMILKLASLFPNLKHLDLSWCNRIYKGICPVLRRCCKIKQLNLNGCSRVNLLGINFVVPQLEVLNLSDTNVDDETLYVISKNCCGLLQLSLENCNDVTNKGVTHVVENCTQLREINLGHFHLSEENRELFSLCGCLLC